MFNKIDMFEELTKKLQEHVKKRSGIYASYLTQMLKKGKYVLLISCEGMEVHPGSDFKNLEFLRDAGLCLRHPKFTERNEFYEYSLTKKGKKIVEKLKKKSPKQ